MKTKTKKIGILSLLAALFACLTMSFAFTLNSAKADATYTSFAMTDGAYIRADSTATGIKFTASISKDDYVAIKTADSDAVFGMAIARVDNATKLLEVAGGADASKVHFPMTDGAWATGKTPSSEDATEYEYSFVVNNISDDNLALNYTAIAYAEINGSKIYASYTDDTSNTRSPLIVAINAKSAGGLSTSEATFIDDVITTVNPTLTFDKSAYTLDGATAVTPKVLVGTVPVNVSYTSNDTGIVEVGLDGSLIAKAKGSTTITASLDGAISATADVTVSKLSASVALTADGILTLGTNNEATTVIVNDGEADIITENLTAGTTTFDLYDAIISDREADGEADAKSYTVTVESENYGGMVTTATIGVISDLDGLKAAASASSVTSKNYYYLTGDITFDSFTTSYYNDNNSQFIVGTKGENIFLNIDGRGYGIKAVTTTRYGARTLFDSIMSSTFKNLVIEYSIPITHSATGLFAYSVDDSSFTNCYVKIVSDATVAEYNQSIVKKIKNTTFENCIFELNDVVATDTYKVIISGHESLSVTINDCAVLTAQEVTESDLLTGADGFTKSVTNLAIYADVATFVGTADNYSAFDTTVWTISSDEITLCGKTVAYFGKDEATSALTADGILTLGTNGEATTVTVNDGEADIITESLTAGTTTFDLYDAIIDYRETNSKHTSKSYTVTVDSANYHSSVNTVSIGAISDLAGLKNAVVASASETNIYYYLTTDIEISADNPYTPTSPDQNYLLTTQAVQTAKINLDGRGYGFKFVPGGYKAGRTLFQNVSDSIFKNLVIEYNLKFTFSRVGTFAYQVSNSVFENCYFKYSTEVTYDGASTYNALYNMSIIKKVAGAKFENCIFELNDVITTDDYITVIAGHETTSGTFNNCAVLSNVTVTDSSLFSDKTVTKSNFDIYTTLASLVETEKNDTTWAGSIKVVETGITLCGKDVATVTE